MKRSLLFTSVLLGISTAFYGQQLENPGFENWEDAGTVIQEPVDWSSIKTSDAGDIINGAAPVVWDTGLVAHSGNFSVKLINKSAFGVIATGLVTNGRVHADFNPANGYIYTDTLDSRWNTPFHWRPDSIAGWFKYYPKGNDFGVVKVLLHVHDAKIPGPQDNWVGYAEYQTPNAVVNTWTRFSVPFTYYDEREPQWLLIMVYSGKGIDAIDSSYAYFDDLEIIYKNAGVDDFATQSSHMYAHNRNISLTFDSQEYYMNQPFELIDLTGRTVYSEKLTSAYITNLPVNIPEGIYVGVLKGKKGIYIQKLLIK